MLEDPPRPTHQDILENGHFGEDYVIDVLIACCHIMGIVERV